jgi:hypothetical protein
MIAKTKGEMYWNAFERLAFYNSHLESADTDTIKKLVFYGIKSMFNKPKPNSYDQANRDFAFISFINEAIGKLTSAQFMTIFPIDKEFDGEKWEMKDYFYTIDYINSIGMDSLIGDNVTEFLWEYYNMSVRLYNVRSMSALSDMRRYQGKPSIMEEWANNNGIKTYTKHTDNQGKEYIMDNEGRTTKLGKPRPKYLRLVK